ncbi:MAG: hypothetical protein KKG75_01655 [Nanoarchaeota archaeon]|nr:hypothetical protein [Nanoarchaeota archaeon]
MLKLDEKEDFKVFSGRYVDQMPLLLAEGRTPLSISDLMKKRLEVLTSSEEIRKVWWDNAFSTRDALVYTPDGQVKVVLDSQHLRELTHERGLINGALPLEDEIYYQLAGPRFSREEIEKCVRGRTFDEVNENPFWQVLARDSNMLFAYSKEIFKHPRESPMGVYIKRPSWIPGSQNKPVLVSWSLQGLNYLSLLMGAQLLDFSAGYIIGERK